MKQTHQGFTYILFWVKIILKNGDLGKLKKQLNKPCMIWCIAEKNKLDMMLNTQL